VVRGGEEAAGAEQDAPRLVDLRLQPAASPLQRGRLPRRELVLALPQREGGGAHAREQDGEHQEHLLAAQERAEADDERSARQRRPPGR
jgi:hypothetical protein